LHVESVAWVAERKDVLSVLFFLLTLWGYSRYAAARDSALSPATSLTDYRSRMTFFYLLTLMCFILGLMTKPMLVTLPFVLLLLDYWPLNRLGTHPTNTHLVREKIPFFALSAVSSVVTFVAQHVGESVATLEQVPLSARLNNALVSYIWYAAKLLWQGH